MTYLHGGLAVPCDLAISSLPIRGSGLRPPRHAYLPALELAKGTSIRLRTWL